MRKHALPSLLAVLLLGGCADDAWQTFPADRAPDSQCRTGGDGGYDVYVWRCEDRATERVVVYQFCTGLTGCDNAERVTGPCGEPTRFERELQGECDTMPDVRRWPTE